jgi:hypothetical protein
MKHENMTVSTVAVGSGADLALLQRVAAVGGGQSYATTDPSNLPRIFTQDTMVHIGKVIREEAFVPRQVEQHAMLRGWNSEHSPPLLGYVKTHRKSLGQVPLVTDQGDPLLATWRFGLGKVTAFTSDCKSRWAASWVAGWSGYSQFWAQILREMSRSAQSPGMDLRIEDQRGRQAGLTVELSEETGEFKNNAEVAADVFYLPSTTSQSAMRRLTSFKLHQTAPGRYEHSFPTDESGVYLVRATSGSDVASIGLVSTFSSEAALGQIDQGLLERAANATGGHLLASDAIKLPPLQATHVEYQELVNPLLQLLLMLFLVDVAIRRWENLVGILELVRRKQ